MLLIGGGGHPAAAICRVSRNNASRAPRQPEQCFLRSCSMYPSDTEWMSSASPCPCAGMQLEPFHTPMPLDEKLLYKRGNRYRYWQRTIAVLVRRAPIGATLAVSKNIGPLRSRSATLKSKLRYTVAKNSTSYALRAQDFFS